LTVEVLATFEAVRRWAGTREGPLGLVPTMGYLHEGHISLLDGARRECRSVVMSLFVNPQQFDDVADLRDYPRDTERDLELAEKAEVDVVFAPEQAEMYPSDPVIGVSVGTLAASMEGTSRPGHFEGVALAVTKLFAGIRPDRAYFGRKDAQQLAIVSRLTLDLSLPVEVVAMPTVREPDGVALGSRNVFLGHEARIRARRLSRGLFAAADAVADGERDGAALESHAGGEAAVEEGIELEYVELASQDDVTRLGHLDRPAFLAMAATIDGVRLIDNVAFDFDHAGPVADRGVRLEMPSMLYSGGED
jgi:pantoate--beta-alanine ligase